MHASRAAAGRQGTCKKCGKAVVVPGGARKGSPQSATQSPPEPQVIHHYHNAAPSQALPALCNFFVPGLGHLVQGRVTDAILWFGFMALVGVGVILTLGIGLILYLPLWILCIWDAARYNPNRKRRSFRPS